MTKEVRVRIDTIIDDYVAGGDYNNENANMGVTPNGLLFTVGGVCLNRDNLKRLEEEFGELVDLHKAGGCHIHDLSLGYLTPYCIGLSMAMLINNGMNTGPVPSGPPKHFRTVINHMVNTIGSVCNEVAGAIAFNDIDVYLGAYAYKFYLDKKKQGVPRQIAFQQTREEVRQSIQELIFHLNQTNRYGGQTPFTNITLAMKCPEDMRDQRASIGSKSLDDFYSYHEDGIKVKNSTYGELEHWQQLVCATILDIFIEGDYTGKGFTFPVLTINVTEDFLDDPEIDHIRSRVWRLTAKYGTPFFQNFINGVTSGDKRLDPRDVRSMCCRLSLDLNDLRSHTGGLFGAGDSTGSLQVVTISLPYLAQHCKANDLSFWEELDRWMELIKDEELWKRKVVNEFYDKGFFPMCMANLPRRFDTFFTTIGFVGLWEATCIATNDSFGFASPEGLEFAKGVLHRMKSNVDRFINETGTLFNLEATPAESASYKLAKKALKSFPDIEHQGLKVRPYFTNSHFVPADMQDQLDLVFATQTQLQVIPSGGTVQHFYLDHEIDEKDAEALVRMICDTNLPYFGLNVTYSMCPICGPVQGIHEACPNEHTPEQIEALRKEHPELVEG